MDAEKITRDLKVEIDNFVFYRKSKVGLIVGKTVEPVISNEKTFLGAGEDCKIKFKLDCPNLNLQQLAAGKFVEFKVKNTYEEKLLRGSIVKQFTLDSFTKYHADDKREAIPF